MKTREGGGKKICQKGEEKVNDAVDCHKSRIQEGEELSRGKRYDIFATVVDESLLLRNTVASHGSYQNTYLFAKCGYLYLKTTKYPCIILLAD